MHTAESVLSWCRSFIVNYEKGQSLTHAQSQSVINSILYQNDIVQILKKKENWIVKRWATYKKTKTQLPELYLYRTEVFKVGGGLKEWKWGGGNDIIVKTYSYECDLV